MLEDSININNFNINNFNNFYYFKVIITLIEIK